MDADDSRVVKDAIEHRGGEQASPAKAPSQLPKVRFEVTITMLREEVQVPLIVTRTLREARRPVAVSGAKL